MQETPELMALLGQWRRLSEGEGHSITKEDWRSLAEQQSQKSRLQQEIRRIIGQERPAEEGDLRMQEGGRLQMLVPELVSLETRNRDLLHAKRRRKQAELDKLGQTSRNLHGLRRAYGGMQMAAWNSYS